MSPNGTLDTPRMPVAEHRRQLANTLFQLANGFCQVRCRADALPDDFVDNSPMRRHRRPAVHNETGEGLR